MTLRRAAGKPFGVWSRLGTDYRAVGMQELYDVVRAQGARNLVVAGGPDWASDLAGVGAGYALDGFNIVYDVHVYTQFHATSEDWDRRFGLVAALVPFTSTEFGPASVIRRWDGTPLRVQGRLVQRAMRAASP